MAEAGYLVDSSYGNLNTGIKGDNSFDQNIGRNDPIITYAEVLKVEGGKIFAKPRLFDESSMFSGGKKSQQIIINIINSDIANIPKAGDTIIVLYDGTDFDYLAKSQKTIGVGQERAVYVDKEKNNPSASKLDQKWGIKQKAGEINELAKQKLLESPNIMEAQYHSVPEVIYHKNAFNLGLWNHMIVFEKYGASVSLNQTYESGSLIGWSNNKYGWYPNIFSTSEFWGRSLWENSKNTTEQKPNTLTWKNQWNNSFIGDNNYIASVQGSTHIYSSNNASFTAEENISIDSKKSIHIHADEELKMMSKNIEIIGKIKLVSQNPSKRAVLGEDLVEILNDINNTMMDMTSWMQRHVHPQLGAPSPDPVSPISRPSVSSILSKNVKLD